MYIIGLYFSQMTISDLTRTVAALPWLSQSPVHLQAEQETELRRLFAGKKASNGMPLDYLIMQSSTWKNEHNRQPILDIAKRVASKQAIGPQGTDLLAELAMRAVDSEKDAFGNTLLEDLQWIANEQLKDGVRGYGLNDGEDTRQKVLIGTMDNILHSYSGAVNGQVNTCAAASVEYALIRAKPAEYARLMSALIANGNGVAMQGRHDVLQFQPDSLPADAVIGNERGRNMASMIFQDAVMEMANGTDDYMVEDDITHPAAAGQKDYPGLKLSGLPHLYSEMLGKPYEILFNSASGTSNNADILEFLKGQQEGSANPVEVSLYTQKSPTQFDGHSYIFVRADAQGNVVLRDPWGSFDAQPPLYGHVDNAKGGLIRLSAEEFLKQKVAVVAPADQRPVPKPAPESSTFLSRSLDRMGGLFATIF